ncbi:putative ABC transport system permease protein [Actinacidiphila alni]|uniref:Putative ABC transport system permease protein n=1 Tax=Actinacidiphila alni TaxID=380248 RepID=A0A1I2J5A7_9ACTN|nr:ABC transporter permease [Actinacidiphila alni]SFF49198.1 putative ABC transport system permease protein [Actinacidiphila alni]
MPDDDETVTPPVPGPDAGARMDTSWVRVRLRSAPAAALTTAALVLATAFLAAALPRSVDRYQDHALREAVRHAKPLDRDVSLASGFDANAGDTVDPLGPDVIDDVERIFQRLVRPPLTVGKGDRAVIGVRTAEATVPDPGLPKLSAHLPAASLVAQAGLDKHTRLAAGRLPHHAPDISGAPAPQSVEAVVTEKTAKTLHLAVGRTLHLNSRSPIPLTVRITGIVTPLDPASPYWTDDADLLAPMISTPNTPPGEDPKPYWHFALFVDRAAAHSMPLLGTTIDRYWHHPLIGDGLTAHDVSGMLKELASFDSGPDAVQLTSDASDNTIHLTGGLGTVLQGYDADREAAQPLVLIAAVGVGTTAFAVLLMAGGLAAERRRGEIALLRSRGAGLRGIVRRLLGETSAAALPGGVLGTVLALLVLPTQRYGQSVLLGALVTAVAALALPLRAAVLARRPRPAGREDVASARPTRRRLVTELTVTVLVVGAVVALRHRGTDSGSDPYLAAAPVLVAVAAALVLLRVYPLPLRLLARPASRLSGAVTHLGLARAGRSPATSQLPLLALLVSLTVASFGGSVLAGIDHGRDRAATATVGADARIDARFSLSLQLPDEVRKVPGVGQVVTARVEPNSPAAPFGLPYSLVIVDPAAYARLTHAIGLPAFPAGLFGKAAAKEPLPAVLSPHLAAVLGDDTASVQAAVGSVDIRRAAVLSATPAAPGTDFVIVSSEQLAALHPDMAAFSQYTGPNVLLAMDAPGTHIDGAALHKVARESTAFVTVLLRDEQRAALSDTPLQHGARSIYLAAVAAGALYSALALLLSLLQAAPQRATLLARLRTMGMTRRQSRRLVLLEMLPQALLAAVGGVLVGLAVIPLLGPGVDLRALTFGTGPQNLVPVDFGLGLRADPWSLALPSVGLLILACAVLLIQVWVSGRRRESTELRVGDRV